MDNLKVEIISGIVLALLVLLKYLKQYLVEYLLEPIKKYFGKEKISVSSLTSGRIVNNLLLELRVKMSADRSEIFLFHNGQHFNPKIINNSIWKFTCAYETCKAGVSYESHNLQGLLVTNHLVLVESLWGKMEEGYEKYPCSDCQMDCDKSKNIIVVVDIPTIAHGNTKNILEAQGVKKLVISPIIIEDDYVGFLAVNYSSGFTFGNLLVNAPNPMGQSGLKTICEYANLIGYYLSNKH